MAIALTKLVKIENFLYNCQETSMKKSKTDLLQLDNITNSGLADDMFTKREALF